MVKNYEEALEIIRNDKSKNLIITGAVSDELIKKTEKILSIEFSPMYKKFLLEFGSIGYYSVDIYGIIAYNVTNSEVPNYTLEGRKEYNLPPHLLIIHNFGNGDLYCQDYSNMSNSEPKIVVYVPGYENEYQTYEVIANNFGDFLIECVNYELKKKMINK